MKFSKRWYKINDIVSEGSLFMIFSAVVSNGLMSIKFGLLAIPRLCGGRE